MQRPNYWRASVCGFVATYMMTVAAQWTRGIGLPPLDPSRLMAFSFGKSPYIFGLLAHMMNGVILGMMYARWEGRVPGNSVWMKGVWVGIGATLAAKIVVAPLVGPFGAFWKGPNVGPAFISSLIAHLVFGIVLAVAYSREGES